MLAIHEGLQQGFGPQCLASSLDTDPSGRVSCRLFEASSECPANCAIDARAPVASDDPARDAITDAPGGDQASEGCLCEMTQLDGDGLEACQVEPSDFPVTTSGAPVHGWCYIDATTQPPLGNPDLVDDCPTPDILRLVGNGFARPGSSLWLVCDE